MLATRDELAVLGKGAPGQRPGDQNASLKADLGSSPGYCQSEGSVQRTVEMVALGNDSRQPIMDSEGSP